MAQTWAYIQSAKFTSGSSSPSTAAYGTNVTAGNTLIVVINHGYNGCPPSLTDTQGNTYTTAVNGTSPGAYTGFGYVFYTVASSSGANTVTATFGCSTLAYGLVMEYSGLAASPFDATANHRNALGSAGNPQTSGPVTTTADDDLVISFWRGVSAPTFTAGSGTPRGSWSPPDSFFLQDQNQSTAGSVDPTCTITLATYPTSGWVVAFKQGGGPPVTTPLSSNFLLLGVN